MIFKPYYTRKAPKKPVQTKFKSCVGWPNPTAKGHCGIGTVRMMGIGATICPQCGAAQKERGRR